jgi:hypothetical protein
MIYKRSKKENRMMNLALHRKHAVHFYLFKGKIRISWTGGNELHGKHFGYK